MIARTLVLNNIEPALLSARSALGVDLDLEITLLDQGGTAIDPTSMMPQLALLPRSSAFGVYPYDAEITGPANGLITVSVPGTVLIDSNGFNLELYQRRTATNPSDPPVAVGLLAKGVLRLEGSAYAKSGPLSMINIPVVTGPMGPMGETGQRGSMWFTGAGDPTPSSPAGAIDGDMYLDESSGNVWRLVGSTWTLGTF